ncbi:MAG: arginine repressor [Planctomycetota bacterium]
MSAQSMSPVQDRRALIRELLSTHQVQSQAELLELLASRGFATTQPVLSRDLRKLKAAKREGVYQLVREGERVTPLENLQQLLRGAQAAGPHMVVVMTEPGAANAIARAIEAEELPGLVGSIAGDDTVFVAVDTPEAGRSLRSLVISLLP